MSDSAIPVTSYPFASAEAGTSVETIGPDIIEVVISFNSGTVAEARAAALEIVSNLTPDDITGLTPELASKATHQDLDDTERRLLANALITSIIFS
jgi:hypothetical protein